MAKFSVCGDDDGDDGGAGTSNPTRAKRKRPTTSVRINDVSSFPPRHGPDEQQTDHDQRHRTERHRHDEQVQEDDSKTPIWSPKARAINDKANSLVSMFLIDPEVLDCSICCEPLSVPIFQCENGHIACFYCCNKLKNKCATCSFPIGYNRCRAVEKILESIKLPCKQSKYGCKEIVGYGGESDHEESCLYAPCKCPFTDCNFMASSQQLSLHFSSEHTDFARNFQFGSSFTIICIKTEDTYTTLQEQDDGTLFIFRYTSEIQGNVVKICCLRPPASEEAFFYSIRVESSDLSLVLQSSMKNVQSSSDLCCSTRFLLIPPDVGSSGKVALNLRIWKKGSSPLRDR